jgi:hypothetical protein
MDLLRRLTENGISAEDLCEQWDRLRGLALRDTLTDLHTLRSLLETQQDALLHNKPVLGATRWFVSEVVALGDDCFAAIMEDGHAENCIVFRYDGDSIKVLIESPPEVP